MQNVSFKRGSSSSFKDLVKDNNTFYYLEDTNELYLGENSISGTKVVSLTQEEYENLSDEEKNNGNIYLISDGSKNIADLTYVDDQDAATLNSAKEYTNTALTWGTI